MAVLISLSDRSIFVIDSTYAEVSAGVERALEQGALIEIKNGAGKKRCINPKQISSIADTDEEELSEQQQQILTSIRAHRRRFRWARWALSGRRD
jgi:hypothetical protein